MKSVIGGFLGQNTAENVSVMKLMKKRPETWPALA